MLNNVGSLDRIVRILIGIGLLSLYFVLEGAQRWWAVVGIVPLATALIGWCPLYVPFGLSTCAKRG
jgi:hypothetical protein